MAVGQVRVLANGMCWFEVPQYYFQVAYIDCTVIVVVSVAQTPPLSYYTLF